MIVREIKYKYNCEQCDFHGNVPGAWAKHIETELHKTGKRKTRTDKTRVEKCHHCEYTLKSERTINMVQHILNEHSTKEERKEKFKYYCEYCDFGGFSQTMIEKHNNTSKHKYTEKLVANIKKSCEK